MFPGEKSLTLKSFYFFNFFTFFNLTARLEWKSQQLMGEEMKEKPSYNLLKEEVIGNCKG